MRGVEIDALSQDPLDCSVDLSCPPFTGHSRLRAEPVGHGLQHVHAMPRRPLRRQVLDDVSHGHLRRRQGHPSGIGDRPVESLGGNSEIGCLASPPCPQIRDTVVCLATAGVHGRFTFERRMLEPRRVPTFTLAELVDLVLQRRTHLRGAFGELLQHLDRHTGHLRLDPPRSRRTRPRSDR